MFLTVLASPSIYGESQAKYYPNCEIIGKTNKSALSYQSGEKMIFSFQLNDTTFHPLVCSFLQKSLAIFKHGKFEQIVK